VPNANRMAESRRSASITRHLTLCADLLSGREHDRQSLAARLGVRPAMADRLIRAAIEHLPGVSERRDGKQRKIRMEAGARTPAPEYPTAVAACFGASLWPLFRGSSYEAGIRNALTHVVGRTKRRLVFENIDRKFCFLRRGGEAALTERQALLDDVIEAVLHHRVVAVRYTHFTGASEQLRLEPLSIVVHDHQLYVVARGPHRALHPYRFARLEWVEVLDEVFPYPRRDAYDPEQVFRDSFGVFLDLPVRSVEIRLDKRWEVYARTHRWHDSQVVVAGPDYVTVKLRVRACPELEAWILGFGEEAHVLRPVGLRRRMAAHARGLARRYRRALTGSSARSSASRGVPLRPRS
jgi:predicted DNA-binding transcriptional regulator YafY